MKERIILVSGAGSSELLNFISDQHRKEINLRILNGTELARRGLMFSGIPLTEGLIGSDQETGFTAKAVALAAEEQKKQGKKPYFDGVSFADIREIHRAIRLMRSLVTEGEEEKEEEMIRETMERGIFEEKNRALVQVFLNYKALLSKQGKMDRIMLIRKAIREANALDAEFSSLKEYPVSPLEQRLLMKLSGEQAVETDLLTLLGGGMGSLVSVRECRNCYGAPNEVEYILSEIYNWFFGEGVELDCCTVAVSDPVTYGQLFFDLAVLYDIPISFGCGIPITNSSPARLLSCYVHWITDGFYGTDALRGMLLSDHFDRTKLGALIHKRGADKGFTEKEFFSWGTFCGVAGGIRLRNDRKFNEERIREWEESVNEEAEEAGAESGRNRELQNKLRYMPAIRILAEVLALPPGEFLAEYAHIRKGSETFSEQLIMRLDQSAVETIRRELQIIFEAAPEENQDELLKNVLSLSVCREKSEPGKLHVTTIEKAPASIRKRLYLVGLSADKYPGNQRENYLMLDSDILLFGDKALAYTSAGRIEQKRKQILRLVRTATSLDCEVYLSYPGLDVSDLKKKNASALIYEIYRVLCGREVSAEELEEKTEKIPYFEPMLSAGRKVGEAYVEGKQIRTVARPSVTPAPVPGDLTLEYSPTALEIFFSCPKRFMLKHILCLEEPEENDPLEVLPANKQGTLVHSLMEKLANSGMNKEDFLLLSEKYFNRLMRENPPVIRERIQTVWEEFREMMDQAYDKNHSQVVLSAEEEIHCTHADTGVNVYGYPDRVEQRSDGSCLIVDFKSGRTLRHKMDDINTCFQVVLYAYLIEAGQHKVSGGEFRYLRQDEAITCRYDGDMQKRLTEKLDDFRQAMQNGKFPAAPSSEEACSFCKYGSICGKKGV